jgi:hypothetical protein
MQVGAANSSTAGWTRGHSEVESVPVFIEKEDQAAAEHAKVAERVIGSFILESACVYARLFGLKQSLASKSCAN